MLIKLEKDVKENLNFVSSYYGDAYWIDKQIPNIVAFEKFKIINEINEMFRTDVINEKVYIKFNGKPSSELLEKREQYLLDRFRTTKVKCDPKHLEKFSEINKIKLKKSHYGTYMKGILKKVKKRLG